MGVGAASPPCRGRGGRCRRARGRSARAGSSWAWSAPSGTAVECGSAENASGDRRRTADRGERRPQPEPARCRGAARTPAASRTGPRGRPPTRPTSEVPGCPPIGVAVAGTEPEPSRARRTRSGRANSTPDPLGMSRSARSIVIVSVIVSSDGPAGARRCRRVIGRPVAVLSVTTCGRRGRPAATGRLVDDRHLVEPVGAPPGHRRRGPPGTGRVVVVGRRPPHRQLRPAEGDRRR